MPHKIKATYCNIILILQSWCYTRFSRSDLTEPETRYAFHYATETGQRPVRIPKENGMAFFNQPRPTKRYGSYHFLFLFPNLLQKQGNEPVCQNGTENFGSNILNGTSGPPPEMIPNILAWRNRIEPFHLHVIKISGIVGIMESTPRYPSHFKCQVALMVFWYQFQLHSTTVLAACVLLKNRTH